MPCPKWSSSSKPPLAAAIAAATHFAWAQPGPNRHVHFQEALRQMIGFAEFERIELRALSMFGLQPDPPEGFEPPPTWAWFEICPGCRDLRKTKYTRAQNGRVKLEVLRDKGWLQERFEAGRSVASIAKRLDCTTSLIIDWTRKHKLKPPKTQAARDFDSEVRRRHYDGEAPGTIARALETPTMHVRQSLARQGIANGKHGHHYFDPEWWRVRLVDRGMTNFAAAREAGIQPHAGLYFVKKFGLQHITNRNNKKGRSVKYPILRDRDALQELLSRHESYETAAAEIGCSPTGLSRAARDLLNAPKRGYPNQLPQSRREWWEERIARGVTTYEMAEEAGILEKSVREKLRLLGLLAKGYANNTRRERERRAGKAA